MRCTRQGRPRHGSLMLVRGNRPKVQNRLSVVTR
jgi:hypothetical protein